MLISVCGTEKVLGKYYNSHSNKQFTDKDFEYSETIAAYLKPPILLSEIPVLFHVKAIVEETQPWLTSATIKY